MEVIKRFDLIVKNNEINKTEEEQINIDSKEYNDLLKIYELAMNQVTDKLNYLQKSINRIYGYTVVEKITSRLKSKKSIMAKMKKKNYEFTYENLVDYIDDIAGVRIVCPVKDDILFVKKIIENVPGINIIKEKDYLTKPKKSGYSAYHLIIETPVKINGETVIMKVEIQIRTAAMDFWSEMEHDIRYKSKRDLSYADSKKLTIYAKILEKIQNKLVKLYRKNENEPIQYIYE